MTKRFSRRHSLQLIILGGVGSLVACSGPSASPTAPAPATVTQAAASTVPPIGASPTVAQSTTAPSATAAVTAPTAGAPAAVAAATATSPTAAPTRPAAAAPTSPAAVAPTSPVAVATASSAAPVVPTAAPAALVQSNALAATRFLQSLTGPTRAKATFPFNHAERQRWHWTTPSGFPRNGLPLKEMSPEQREVALALLRAGSSDAGYTKALDIISLQTELNNDPELYYVSIFGTPGGNAPWGWRFEGHHLSRHVTVTGDTIIMTPFFLGSWPTTSRAGLRAMGREEEAARELVRSLDGQRRGMAIFQGRPLTEHVTQNEARVKPLAPVGIMAGDLANDPRRLMDEILQTYLGVLPPAVATPLWERLRQSGADTIRFGWAGGLEPRQPHYYRLQGPTFLLEFDNSRNGGTHIHSVWRDFAEDFGLPPA